MNKTRTRLGVVVAVLALTLAVSAMAGAAKYVDGVWMGVSDGDRHGYGMAIVMVQNDQIINVVYNEMKETGEVKDASYPWPQFHEAVKVLPQRFVEANSADIDGLSQATGTSDKARQAVARALDKALVEKGTRKYQDGTFYGISTNKEQSIGIVWVTIKDDKIVKVEADEWQNGAWKDWPNYPFPAATEAKAIYEQAFVEAQGPEIDIITHATHSGHKYMEAVEAALASAARF